MSKKFWIFLIWIFAKKLYYYRKNKLFVSSIQVCLFLLSLWILQFNTSFTLSILFHHNKNFVTNMGFFLADIVNVYQQNSLRIAKENLITPALILNNVANMVIVKPWSSLVGRLVPVAKSKCFHDFLKYIPRYLCKTSTYIL